MVRSYNAIDSSHFYRLMRTDIQSSTSLPYHSHPASLPPAMPGCFRPIKTCTDPPFSFIYPKSHLFSNTRPCIPTSKRNPRWNAIGQIMPQMLGTVPWTADMKQI